MHSIDYTPPTAAALGPSLHALGADGNSTKVVLDTQVRFRAEQSAPPERRLDVLFREKIACQEHFYGVELLARSYNKPAVLDYSSFGVVLPLFTSLVWLGQDYWSVEPTKEVESVRFAQQLRPHTIVMPHFTCYRTNCARVEQMMALNFSNVLALRGDVVDPQQEFQHAGDMVVAIRKLRGDTISIGVAGYPGGHPDAKSLEDDMQYLKKKVEAGADFIITQLVFSTEVIKEFVRNCRAHDIKVPIIVGIFVPESMQALTRILRITRVPFATEQLERYEAVSGKAKEFRKLAVQNAVEMITELFDSDLDIYGIQFFSMNKFKSISRILAEISPKYFEQKSSC